MFPRNLLPHRLAHVIAKSHPRSVSSCAKKIPTDNPAFSRRSNVAQPLVSTLIAVRKYTLEALKSLGPARATSSKIPAANAPAPAASCDSTRDSRYWGIRSDNSIPSHTLPVRISASNPLQIILTRLLAGGIRPDKNPILPGGESAKYFSLQSFASARKRAQLSSGRIPEKKARLHSPAKLWRLKYLADSPPGRIGFLSGRMPPASRAR